MCILRHPRALEVTLCFALLPFALASDDDCLVCHEEAMTAASGIPYAESIHGELDLGCTACHMEMSIDELPHAEPIAAVDCSLCHDVLDDTMASVHGNDGEPVATCVDCHGAHDVLPSTEPRSRTYIFNVSTTCGGCHGIAEGSESTNGAPQTTRSFEDGIHGHALLESGLNVAPTCVTCHGSHTILHSADPASGTHRTHVPATCGTCHEGIIAEYDRSVHGSLLAGLDKRVAICTDCHAAHAIALTDVPAWRLSVIEECGNCHEHAAESYAETFHGKVTRLGFDRVAACADCHGDHAILPLDDPHSAVVGDNRVVTCGKCHDESGAEWVRYKSHPDPNDREQHPELFWSTRLMQGLLLFVFAFFVVHTSLWLPREITARRARRRGKEQA